MRAMWSMWAFISGPSRLRACALALSAGLILAGHAAEKKDAEARDRKPTRRELRALATNEVAVIKTSAGVMVLELWPDVAPRTVENFKALARKGFYDGTAFHRVIKGFMIQGGDPLTRDPAKEAKWGEGGPGYVIRGEFNERVHERGVISMARADDPDSAGSQFFICLAPASSPNMENLNRKYACFGQVIKGDDVLEKIASAPTHPPDRPNARQEVESVRIVPADSVE